MNRLFTVVGASLKSCLSNVMAVLRGQREADAEKTELSNLSRCNDYHGLCYVIYTNVKRARMNALQGSYRCIAKVYREELT